MKIAISSTGGSMDSKVDPRFGRAVGFVIHDTDSGESRFIDNRQNMSAAQGAGIQAAKTVSDSGAEVVLTGHCGPKAFRSLQAAKIRIFTGAEGTLADTIEKFEKGEFKESASADVQGHW